jgi:hypothetical protein
VSKKEKLIIRLLSKPKDFTYDEMRTLLNYFDYVEINKGKTSGSRIAFCHQNKGKKIISIHKPHPGNILKMYVIELIINLLRENGEI